MILFHAHFWTSKFLLKSQQNLVELWVRRTMWSHVSAFLPLEVYSFFQANNLAKAQETIIAKGKLSETPVFFWKLRAREKSLIVVSYRQKGRRPQCYTRAERARARARARAKYPGHFRPAKKRPYQWIFEFFLRDWQELDEILPTIATKNQKFEENLRKKIHLKNRKITQNRIDRHNFKLEICM